MSRYILSKDIPDDLFAIWDFIAQDRPDAADAVIDAAWKAFDALAAHPHLGPAARLRHARIKDLRSYPIPDYPNYVVFYRVEPGVVQIVHVYHGARDLDALFEDR